MLLLDKISDDLLIIVPSNIKENAIKKISLTNKFYSYKIINEIELKKMVCFDYGMDAIFYIANKYDVNSSNAKEYIEAMYYLEDKEYKSDKLNKLNEIKKELIENNLLVFSKNFLNVIENKHVIVYGFDVISKGLQYFLNKLNLNYEIVNENYNFDKPFIYKYETLEEEVDALCYQISTLINNGVDINNIKIANVGSEYIFTIKQYFKMYNLAINLPNNSSLYSLLAVQEFAKKCFETNNLQDGLDYILNTYPLERDLYYALLNVSNRFVGLDLSLSHDAFIYSLKTSKIPQKKLNNAIEIIKLDNAIIEDGEHVFVLSVNQGIYPKSYKDEDFLSDKDKEELAIDTSDDLNHLSKVKFKKLLSKSNNLILSYKEKSAFAGFTKAFSIIEEGLEERTFVKDDLISYAPEIDKLHLAKVYDKIYQSVDNHGIMVLNSNYNINYKTYDHSFVPFASSKIKDYIKEHNRKLSYSAIDNYFKCGFRYYLNNILCIGESKSIRAADIGTAFHAVLEDSYKDGFDFEESFKKQYDKLDDIVTKFYLAKYKGLLKDILRLNVELMKDSQLVNVLTEKEILIDNNAPINMKFKGIVDKIYYTDPDDTGTTYLSVIDYKTSNPKIDLNMVKYGLSMQLPIYLYLIDESKLFDKYEVCGFYLQTLIPSNKKAYEDQENLIKQTLALQGFSNSNVSILSKFDPHYEHSELIKSMSVKKDGTFNAHSKILSSEEIKDLTVQVKEKILEALNDISECKFFINPKYVNGKEQSCLFCDFGECCFKNHNDNVYLDNIKEVDDEDGGEE